MTRATVRDLRYNFPAIERRLRHGEEIEITKRGQPIGRLTAINPVRPRRPSAPESLAWLQETFGDQVLDVQALIRYDRGEG